MMTLDEAIALVRRQTPPDDPWVTDDLCDGFDDYGCAEAIAAILNAVLSGDLVPATRAEAEAALAEAKGRTLAESGPDFLARVGLDASKWAAEFRAIAKRLGYSDMDEGWLIGWFASAIEAARATAPARDAARDEAEARDRLEGWNAAVEAAAAMHDEAEAEDILTLRKETP